MKEGSSVTNNCEIDTREAQGESSPTAATAGATAVLLGPS